MVLRPRLVSLRTDGGTHDGHTGYLWLPTANLLRIGWALGVAKLQMVMPSGFPSQISGGLLAEMGQNRAGEFGR